MKIKEDDYLLVIRYSDIYEDNCIDKHIDVLKKNGYVYFGKCGSKPSLNVYNKIMKSANPKIVLISKDTAYVCDIEEIVFDMPKNGCPEYYNKLIEKNVRFSAFFKIKSIYNLGRKNIGVFYVASSLSNLSDALHHSMTSMMLVKAKQDYLIEEMK